MDSSLAAPAWHTSYGVPPWCPSSPRLLYSREYSVRPGRRTELLLIRRGARSTHRSLWLGAFVAFWVLALSVRYLAQTAIGGGYSLTYIRDIQHVRSGQM